MKRLVVCCDGTWNSPDKTSEGVPVATNVVRVAEAVERQDAAGIEQRLFYDAGVGTSGGWLSRVFDGATGTGLSRNLLDAYEFLVQNFDRGDELYLFGFSRGAFTVRSLAGLVRKCGVLDRSYLSLVPRAYALYRARGNASHPRGREATLFRRTYALAEETPIRFIGVWDTVGSLGNPLWATSWLSRRNRFHDLALSSRVQFAHQALAIDEQRRHFKAAIWEQSPEAPEEQVLEQVWFVGAHSNVGGGYPSTGLSDLALDWMVGKARAAGLALASIAVHPAPSERVGRSRRGFYRIVPRWLRPIARPPEGTRTNESLHPSVLERYRSDPEYRPKNLLAYLARQEVGG